MWIKSHRIKVLHNVPGRMRIKVPGMDKLPDKYKIYEPKLTELFLLLRGILRVEYSYITGKILIEYDQKKIDERQVLAWSEHIWDSLTKKAVERDSPPSKEELDAELDAFMKVMQQDVLKIQ